MVLPSSPETPTPRRRRCGRILLAVFLALIGAGGWQLFTARQAIHQLEAAGFEYDEPSLWKIALNDLYMFFQSYPSRAVVNERDHSSNSRVAQLRNFDVVGPALRRLNPDGITLIVPGCPSLENLNALDGLTALRWIAINSCTSLRNLDGLKGLPRLKYLDLYGCKALQDPGAFQGLATLERLRFSGYTVLQNTDGLKGLTNLTQLEIGYCPSLENVDALKHLTNLKELGISHCPKLSAESIAALRGALPKTLIVVE